MKEIDIACPNLRKLRVLSSSTRFLDDFQGSFLDQNCNALRQAKPFPGNHPARREKRHRKP